MNIIAHESNAEFNYLKNLLEDGACHVYTNRRLPNGCSPATSRIGFEHTDGVYKLFIDYGIRSSIPSNTIVKEQFNQWIRDGELMFFDFNDLKEFLKSLRELY